MDHHQQIVRGLRSGSGTTPETAQGTLALPDGCSCALFALAGVESVLDPQPGPSKVWKQAARLDMQARKAFWNDSTSGVRCFSSHSHKPQEHVRQSRT